MAQRISQPQNRLIAEHRIGRIQINIGLIEDADADQLLKVLDRFLVVRAEYLYPARAIEYVAYSDLFEQVPRGCREPDYIALLQCNDNDEYEIVGVERYGGCACSTAKVESK
jgi:hypothetical protein